MKLNHRKIDLFHLLLAFFEWAETLEINRQNSRVDAIKVALFRAKLPELFAST